jgi:Helix-turn-helix domain
MTANSTNQLRQQNSNLSKRYLNTGEAASYTGIPAATLRAWRSEGTGPIFYKPRGRALYDVADLDSFMRSGLRLPSVRASKERERNVAV